MIKIAVPIECDGRFCGPCFFQGRDFFDENICIVHPDDDNDGCHVILLNNDGQNYRCRQCIEAEIKE